MTYALAKEIQAVRTHSNEVVLVAEGTIAACHEAYFQPSPVLIFPPHYELLQRDTRKPGEMCPAIMMPYRVVKPIQYPSNQEVVHVRDAAGDHAVKITPVDLSPFLAAGATKTREATHFVAANLSSEAMQKFEVRTGIGYSESYDVGEAIRNAMRNLPPDPAASAGDMLNYYKVTEIAVEKGGIVGFDHLRVVIQTYDPGK